MPDDRFGLPLRIRLTAEMRAWLLLEGSRRGTTASQVMRDLIRAAMDKSPRRPAAARGEHGLHAVTSKLAPELPDEDNV